MSTEPVTNQAAASNGTGSRWADDSGVLTESRAPGADPAHLDGSDHPETPSPVAEPMAPTESETDVLADPDEGTALDEAPTTDDVAETAQTTAAETTAQPAPTPALHEPLITAETEEGFLNRWAEIQVGFVEDPAKSVSDADALIQEIADSLHNTLAARRADLAADWQHGTPDTEQLRLALRRYRSFLGVILPK